MGRLIDRRESRDLFVPEDILEDDLMPERDSVKGAPNHRCGNLCNRNGTSSLESFLYKSSDKESSCPDDVRHHVDAGRLQQEPVQNCSLSRTTLRFADD